MLKLGVIGTGWIVEKWIDAVRRSQTFEPVAVCSRDEARAKAFAEKNGLNEYYTNSLSMLLESEVQVVYIATPNSMHYAFAQACLEHGKHVIVEKPVTVDPKRLESLMKTAGFRSVYLFEAMRTLYNPAFAALKEALSKVGEIRYAYFAHMQYSSKYDAFKAGKNPPVFSAEFAGGASTDLGVYSVAAAYELFGTPIETQASSVILPGGVDGVSVQLLHYGNFICNISSSKISNTMLGSEIQGEKGTLYLDHLADLNRIIFKDNAGKEEIIWDKHHENDMVFEAEYFARIIACLDNAAYGKIQAQMRATVALTQASRAEAGYSFPCDR